MAGFASASQDIRTAFNAALAVSQPTVNIYWPNDPREAEADQPSTTDEFIMVSILEAPRAYLPEIGSRMAEVSGLVHAMVFTPKGRGDLRNRQICDSVRDALQGLRHGDVKLRGSRRNPRGIELRPTHYQANVTTPFRFESTPV